jgi:hypothetical protein
MLIYTPKLKWNILNVKKEKLNDLWSQGLGIKQILLLL